MLTKWTTNQNVYPSKTTKSTTENTMYVNKSPLTEGEINTSHILIGVGVSISLLLFIIAIQLCKRSNSVRMNTSDQRAYDEPNGVRRRHEHARNLNRSTNDTWKFYKPIEAEYHRIDEHLNTDHSPDIKITVPELEIPHLLQDSDNFRAYPSRRENNLCHQMNDFYVEPFKLPSDLRNSDLYLHPVNISVQDNQDHDHEEKTFDARV